jgi:MoaA/NifB/PqqE/SkfB family radical SAM enzyme
MIGQPVSFRRAWELFRDPVTSEKRNLLSERWSGLASDVKVAGQGYGQKATGCGATVGIQPKCDFSCTGCYLGSEANRIPALPVEAVLEQLRQLRGYLGPKSNVQITDGEVTLRPVEELIEILSYARSIGVVPMLMTHGDTFRTKPGLLETLMSEANLTEVSIHIDITQRGRVGYKAPRDERELHPLRDEFANMVREARRKTGKPLRAATTLTVTSDNIGQLSDVIRWSFENRDAFSLISLQPLAQVGRTRKNLLGVTPETVWREIAMGLEPFGAAFRSAEPMHFGHPECTRFVSFMTLERDGKAKLMQLIRDHPDDVAIMKEYFELGIAGAAFRDDHAIEMIARGAGMIGRAPKWMFTRARKWFDGRVREEFGVSMRKFFTDVAMRRAKLGSFTVTSHHFMSPAELQTDLGQARLAACVFRLPHNGEMVPMCQMNAGGVREQVYAEITQQAAQSAPTAAHV